MAIRDFLKDPDADRSFPVDWEDALAAADSISSSLWIVPAGLTQVSSAISGKRTSVRLSGGTDGQDYLVVNRVTLASGEIDERTIRVAVRHGENTLTPPPPPAETGALLLEAGANAKISALVDGAPALATDQLVVARSGVSRRVTVSDIVAVPLPLKKFTRVFTAAEVKALFSTPIEVLPAVPGIVYMIHIATFNKDAGGAFVGGAGKNLNVQYVASTPVGGIGNLDAAFLDVAAANGRLSSPSLLGLIGEAAVDLGGKAMRMNLSTADLTGTGASCTLRLWYYELPSAV